MGSPDTTVTLSPYFKIHEGKFDQFQKYVADFYSLIPPETKLVHYSFCFDGETGALCREGYTDADGLKIHLDNVGKTFVEALSTCADLERIEVHGPSAEVDILAEHPVLKDLNTRFFKLDGKGVRYGERS